MIPLFAGLDHFGVSWYDAVRFCRWLSEQESIPEDQMCYPPFDEIQDNDRGTLQLPDDYLTRTGYRLPTEAEVIRCADHLDSHKSVQGQVTRLINDPHPSLTQDADQLVAVNMRNSVLFTLIDLSRSGRRSQIRWG